MDINNYVAQELEKYQGVAFPVKAGGLERLFVPGEGSMDLIPFSWKRMMIAGRTKL